jgi:hypothetical protein
MRERPDEVKRLPQGALKGERLVSLSPPRLGARRTVACCHFAQLKQVALHSVKTNRQRERESLGKICAWGGFRGFQVLRA